MTDSKGPFQYQQEKAPAQKGRYRGSWVGGGRARVSTGDFPGVFPRGGKSCGLVANCYGPHGVNAIQFYARLLNFSPLIVEQSRRTGPSTPAGYWGFFMPASEQSRKPHKTVRYRPPSKKTPPMRDGAKVAPLR